MKKILLFILCYFCIIFSVNASEYMCHINGDDVMHPYDESRSNWFYIVSEKINIDNIEELSTFKMFISYDNTLYSVNGCNLLNNTSADCSINKNNNDVYYTYKYSSKYKLDNDFYTVNFISNKNTPSEGSSEIKVYFESAKDKNGNKVTIEPCTTNITFKDLEGYFVPSEVNVLDEDSEVSSYIKNLKIKGYNIDFDKEKEEYNLNVESDVNKLDVSVELYDKNATYLIRGASDLNSFGNKIIILVKSSDNEEREYKINVIKDKQDVQTEDIKEDVKGIFSKENIKKYLPIILGGIILIIIIIAIIKKISSKKLDKYLDNI